MSKNIYEIPNKPTSAPDDALVYVAIPGGINPDPYEDAALEKSDFFLPLQTQITDNADAITVIEADVAVVKANSVKQTFTNKTSTFNFTQYKDEHIELMIFRQKSGTSTVSIGISPSVDDILTSRVIDSTEYRNTNTVVSPGTNDRTILVNVTGGSVDLVVFSKRLVFGL